MLAGRLAETGGKPAVKTVNAIFPIILTLQCPRRRNFYSALTCIIKHLYLLILNSSILLSMLYCCTNYSFLNKILSNYPGSFAAPNFYLRVLIIAGTSTAYGQAERFTGHQQEKGQRTERIMFSRA